MESLLGRYIAVSSICCKRAEQQKTWFWSERVGGRGDDAAKEWSWCAEGLTRKDWESDRRVMG